MITIVYCTARDNPRFQWFADSLSNQIGDINHQLIIVDSRLWYMDRTDEFKSIINNRLSYIHIAPKLTVWAGPRRLTKRDYYALSNARNTALIHAIYSHVAFCDDCSVLSERWLHHHLEAAKNGICMAGPSIKYFNMNVENGKLVSHGDQCLLRADTRSNIVSKEIDEDTRDPIPVNSSWLYGCNFSVPLDKALSINGFDEEYDGQSNIEDCDFSLRLSHIGETIYYHRDCAIYESAEDHQRPWEVRQKEIDGRWANEFRIKDCIKRKKNWALNYGRSLIGLRKHVHSGGFIPFSPEPTNDWRDNQILQEM